MAKRKYFNIRGINPPGRVNLRSRGEVRLHNLSDDELYEIYKEGSDKCPFVSLTPEGYKHYYPSQKTIQTSSTQSKTGSDEKKSSSAKKKTGGPLIKVRIPAPHNNACMASCIP